MATAVGGPGHPSCQGRPTPSPPPEFPGDRLPGTVGARSSHPSATTQCHHRRECHPQPPPSTPSGAPFLSHLGSWAAEQPHVLNCELIWLLGMMGLQPRT